MSILKKLAIGSLALVALLNVKGAKRAAAEPTTPGKQRPARAAKKTTAARSARRKTATAKASAHKTTAAKRSRTPAASKRAG